MSDSGTIALLGNGIWTTCYFS